MKRTSRKLSLIAALVFAFCTFFVPASAAQEEVVLDLSKGDLVFRVEVKTGKVVINQNGVDTKMDTGSPIVITQNEVTTAHDIRFTNSIPNVTIRDVQTTGHIFVQAPDTVLTVEGENRIDTIDKTSLEVPENASLHLQMKGNLSISAKEGNAIGCSSNSESVAMTGESGSIAVTGQGTLSLHSTGDYDFGHGAKFSGASLSTFAWTGEGEGLEVVLDGNGLSENTAPVRSNVTVSGAGAGRYTGAYDADGKLAIGVDLSVAKENGAETEEATVGETVVLKANLQTEAPLPGKIGFTVGEDARVEVAIQGNAGELTHQITVPSGELAVQAEFLPEDDSLGSLPAQKKIRVNPLEGIALAAPLLSQSTAKSGESIILTAQVGNTAYPPLGTVAFFAGDIKIGEAPVEDGAAKLEYAVALEEGNHPITAQYQMAGSDYYANGLRSGANILSVIKGSLPDQIIFPTAKETTYRPGLRLFDVELIGGDNFGTFVWEEDRELFSGSAEYPVIFTANPGQFSGEQTKRGLVRVTVEKAKVESVIFPTRTEPLIFGQALEESTFFDGNDLGLGTFVWEDGAVVLGAGQHQQRLNYQLNDIDNYELAGTESGLVEVRVEPREIGLSLTGENVSVGQRLTLNAKILDYESLPETKPNGQAVFYADNREIGRVDMADDAATFSLSSLTAGSYEFSVCYENDDNYICNTPSLASIRVEGEEETDAVAFPQSATLYYGQKLEEAVLLGGYGDGEFIWVDGKTEPTFGQKQSFALSFVPGDPAAETVTENVPVIVLSPAFQNTQEVVEISLGEAFTLIPTKNDRHGADGWEYDQNMLSATFNSPANFTAVAPGETTITYTTLDGFVLEQRVVILGEVEPAPLLFGDNAATGDDGPLLSILLLLLLGTGTVLLLQKKSV